MLFPFIVGWAEPSVAFDVAVHAGTLVSVLWVFRDRVAGMLRALVSWSTTPERDRRALRLVVLGSVPAGIVGLAAGSRLESTFERPVLVSILLAVNGWAMLSSERIHRERKSEEQQEDDLDAADASLVGVAQAAAILPGISRSGATIGAGLVRGFSRETAAQFSFLLAIPAIAGATIVKVPDIAREDAGVIIVGIAAAAISGTWALRAFLALVRRRGLRPFGIYCFFVTTAGILAALARG